MLQASSTAPARWELGGASSNRQAMLTVMAGVPVIGSARAGEELRLHLHGANGAEPVVRTRTRLATSGAWTRTRPVAAISGSLTPPASHRQRLIPGERDTITPAA